MGKQKIINRILAACCLVLCTTISPRASADSVTDTLAVYVGYYGGPYYLKESYHWTALDDLYGGALDTHEVAYTYTHDGRVAIDSARGFYLSDFLQYAGVDMNSIASLDFYTKDHTSGAYRTFTKYSLLDAPRYYFPNLTVDEATGAFYPRNGEDIWDGATRVEAMMALEDHWEWGAEDSYFASPNTSSRFRLLFGQLTPDESMTSAAAKYVYAIYVTFSGMPTLTVDTPEIPLKVGSDYQITVNVTAQDSLLTQYIQENLTWSANQSDIIDVDQYGNLTAKKAGEGTITAKFGDSSVTMTVIVDDSGQSSGGVIAPPNSGGEAGASPQGGEITSLPEGAVTTPPQDSEATPPSEKPSDVAGDTPQKPADNGAEQVTYSGHESGVYILSKGLMLKLEDSEWVNSVLAQNATTGGQTGGIANWREGAMSAEAQALEIQINTPMTWPVYCTLAGVFVLGMTGSMTSFRRQTKIGSKKEWESKKHAH